MNRAKIKMQAKEIISGNLGTILLPYIIVGLISFVVSFFLTVLLGTSEEISILVTLVTPLILYPLELGVLKYIMKFVRKEKCDLNIIFDFYKMFLPAIGLTILITLFTSLWSLLFIIPGIIASYSYMMANYLMVDGENDPMECIKKSKAMMKGYKMDLFVFHLSFLGWILLSVLTFGLLFIYVGPYMNVAQILYYEELNKMQNV